MIKELLDRILKFYKNDGKVKKMTYYEKSSVELNCDNQTETEPKGIAIFDGFVIYDTRLVGYHGKKESITIPSFVRSIAAQAFAENKIIKEVIIPENVTLIGGLAFANCSNLLHIKVKNRNTIIGEGAFDRTAWYNNQNDGLVYYENNLYSVKGKCKSNVEIEKGTTSISPFAFYNRKELKSITIPESIQVINTGTFMDCTSLKEITFIGKELKYICDMAFQNCEKIEKVYLPRSVKHIGKAFTGCNNLQNILIYDNVEFIDEEAFDKCNTTIHCLANSYVHKFAIQHNINFSIYEPKK